MIPETQVGYADIQENVLEAQLHGRVRVAPDQVYKQQIEPHSHNGTRIVEQFEVKDAFFFHVAYSHV